MLKKESAKRLRILARYLKKVPDSKFDMREWKCGSAACALGWACSIPSFKKLGLSLACMSGEFYPTYDNHDSYSAGQLFFGLNDNQTGYLFSGDSYKDDKASNSTYTCVNNVSRKDVIKRIEEIARKKEKGASY